MCGSVISVAKVRARKAHRCEACGTPIPAGFDYIKTAEVDSRDFYASKWHVECREEFDRALSENGDDCMDPWSTWECGLPPAVWQRYVHGPLPLEERDS